MIHLYFFESLNIETSTHKKRNILNLLSKNPTKLVSYYLKNICKDVLKIRLHKVLCL